MSELDTSSAVARYLAERQPADAARASMALAVGTNPDQEAEFRRLSAQSGVPVDSVRAFPSDVKQSNAVNALDFKSLAQRFPATTAYLSGLDNARIAHDDVDNLSMFETVANSFRRGVPGLKQIGSATALRANSGILASIDQVEQRLAGGVNPAVIPDEQDPYGVRWMTKAERDGFRTLTLRAAGGNAASIATNQAEKDAILQPAIVEQVMSAGKGKDFMPAMQATIGAFLKSPVQFVASVGPESLVTSAPGLAAAIPATIAGGPAGGAAALGIGSFATDYGSSVLEALSGQGVDLKNPAALEAAAKDPALMRRVAAQAIAHAAVVGSVDAVSGGVASKLALPGKLATTLAKYPAARELAGAVAQVPVQGALGAAGEAGGQIAAGQPLDAGNIFAEFVGEAFSAPAEVASVGIGQVRERMAAAERASGNAALLTQLDELAKASKVKGRDTASFDAFVKSATENGPVKDLFISPEALAQSGVDLQQLAAASPAVAEQIEAAVAAGTDIRIPVGEFAANLAGTEFAQSLIPHLKTEADGFSQTEADAYMKTHGEDLKAEVESVLARQEGTDAFRASRDAVQADVLGQLAATKRFTDDVSKPYAALVAARYGTLAQQLGMTPDEAFRQYPIRFQAEGMATDSLAQQQVVDLAAGWRSMVIGDTTINASVRDGYAEISMVSTPADKRGQGSARKAMEQLTREADARGVALFLTAEPMDKGVSKAKLQAFYKSLGFKPNKGRNSDFRAMAGMVRQPQALAQEAAAKPTPEHVELLKRESVLKSILECLA